MVSHDERANSVSMNHAAERERAQRERERERERERGREGGREREITKRNECIKGLQLNFL